MYVRLMLLLITGTLGFAQQPAPPGKAAPQALPQAQASPRPERTPGAAPEFEAPSPRPTPRFELFPQPAPNRPRAQALPGLPFIANRNLPAVQIASPPKTCSIPLIEMPGTAQHQGKIVTVPPQGPRAVMPNVALPAPPCDKR
jgi:hypothetical protein